MILYYAVGGGLGHISRSVAILSHSPWLAGRSRLMTSSSLTWISARHCQCPLDFVSGEITMSKRKYAAFLSDYIKSRSVKLVIVDSFPSGIVGEWGWVSPGVPMILVARRVKWKEYVRMAGGKLAVAPAHTLAIEPLDEEANMALEKCGELSQADSPVTLWQANGGDPKRGVLVVHSGSDSELAELKKIAQERAGGAEAVEVISPDRGIYPAESYVRKYSTIVSGAGYNMSALAALAPPEVTHILHPFARRYDDQFLRARRIGEGMWRGAPADGALKAAAWLEERVKRLIS